MFIVELTDSWSNIINIFIGDSTKINLRRLTYLYNHGQSPLDLIERCVSLSQKYDHSGEQHIHDEFLATIIFHQSNPSKGTEAETNQNINKYNSTNRGWDD